MRGEVAEVMKKILSSEERSGRIESEVEKEGEKNSMEDGLIF